MKPRNRLSLALLSACHGRISRQCATLERLSRHLPAHGSDAAAQTAAASVLRYFDTAAVHHHEDEEEDLFPALIESMAGSDAVCLHALVDGLHIGQFIEAYQGLLNRQP